MSTAALWRMKANEEHRSVHSRSGVPHWPVKKLLTARLLHYILTLGKANLVPQWSSSDHPFQLQEKPPMSPSHPSNANSMSRPSRISQPDKRLFKTRDNRNHHVAMSRSRQPKKQSKRPCPECLKPPQSARQVLSEKGQMQTSCSECRNVPTKQALILKTRHNKIIHIVPNVPAKDSSYHSHPLACYVTIMRNTR